MNMPESSKVKYQWIAFGLVILGLVIGYSIPILQSSEVFAASSTCKAECKGKNCPHAQGGKCNAIDCIAGICDCQK